VVGWRERPGSIAISTPSAFSGILAQRFESVRVLGHGGMAEVYLAIDRFSRRQVAIKVVRMGSAASEERAQLEHLWVNEMRLAGRLKHPYILEIYEAGTEGDRNFLVMEYVNGGTLKAHTRPGSLLEIPRVADIVFKVCHALEYANTQGLLHRDIKPDNILLAEDGTPKVSDFGAAYLTNSDTTQVIGVGTLPFMPPEHFEGAEPNAQHDIYGAGVMAYLLLTGAYPHGGESQAAMIFEKLHRAPVPLEVRRPQVPPALRIAVERAMHRDPKARFATWNAFREALSAAFPELGQVEGVGESARFEAMRRIAFFQRFSENEVWEAVRISTVAEFPAGHEVITEGSDDSTVYVVESGELEVVHRGVRIGRVPTGEVFGEISFLEGTERPRSASVRTVTPAVVVAFRPEGLKTVSGPLQVAFGRAMVRQLVRRLCNANDRYVAAVRAKVTTPP
jgi:eukaryotic-like serine/threonine-protein kinase